MHEIITKKILHKVYPRRSEWSHKGQYGKLLVVSGSERHTGSPIFAAMAAYRSGCDLVYVAAPKRPADIAASFSPNLITEPLEGKKLEPRHVGQILQLLEETRCTAVLIGPGLWRDKATFQAICQLISQVELPMVIDADAIRAVGRKKEILAGKTMVLTPHSNEFLELWRGKLGTNVEQRVEAVQQTSRELNSTVLLKGHVDVISDGKNTALNKTGSALMTKGGFGDTLAGICAAFLARGSQPFDAACAAAYINGKAGELCAKEFGEGMLATDLIEKIPVVLKEKS